MNLGIDSIVAIPLSEWSLDYVRPSAQCTRREGDRGVECVADVFPAPPEGSVVVPFATETNLADALPPGIIDQDVRLVKIDPGTPLVDLTGSVPKPGLYVLVANYFQPGAGKEFPFSKMFLS